MEHNLDDIRQDIGKLARDVGAQLRIDFSNPKETTIKKNVTDIVTQSDKDAEAAIVRVLQAHYPHHHIVGEESGAVASGTTDYYWYIDPIDGTTNFASGIPHFSISIALTDQEYRPLVGVVYDPMRDELFSAAKGQGATLNGVSIRITAKTDLLQCVLGSGFGADKHTNPDNNADQWAAMLRKTRGLRRFGSAALDFSYVACGRFDGYWDRTLNRWDALAGMLLVTEAGGMVTDYRGGFAPQLGEDGRYVASNGLIHPQILDVLAQSYGWS